MPDRPTSLWKAMPPEKRVLAAEAFWRDTDSPDIEVQHAEAVGALARRLNFRTPSILALPVAKRAKHLAQLGDVTDTIATRALIAYHFAHQRPLMGAFLEALGIEHEDGLIKAEQVEAPSRQRLADAVGVVQQAFDRGDVDLYLRTLTTLDSETWANVEGLLTAS